MKKIFLFSILVFVNSYLISQTLISSYNFPNFNPYNFFWGLTEKNDTLWIGTDYDGGNYPFSLLYKVTKTGIIMDSLSTPFKFNHGLVWDGTGFWIAEDYRSSGARIYKINTLGLQIDSIYTGTYAQGIGGLARDGNNLWFTVYYPDYTSYPFAYAYKINLTTKQIVDTIPLRGKQVYGITLKGDTIFYVNDNFQGEQERIYAYRKAIGDTLFSFAVPDPDGDCEPKGMHWDGANLWLLAYRVGGSANQYKTLYKYSLSGQGSPQIVTSVNNINFVNTIIGNTSNFQLTINNVGTANLIINGKNFTNPVFGISPSFVPDTITPGQSKNYNVTFTPNIYDTVSGQLQIASNDAGNPLKIITLKGKGVYNGSYITLSDSSYGYGNRRTGSLCGWTFSILNAGSNPLTISSITFNNYLFSLDTLGLNLPVVIDTQKVRKFRVWYKVTNGNSNCTMTINSNAINSPVKTVSLSGTGSYTAPQLGDIAWQGRIPDNPSSMNLFYKPISIKQIDDVNNDGINDVIVASDNYLTSCYNGNSSVTSDVIWSFNTGITGINTGSVTYEEALQIRNDIDGDGIQDIVIGCGGGNENVYTISGRTGRQIWVYGDTLTTVPQGAINGIRVDKDFNGDGIYDVIVTASGTGELANPGRHALICLNGLNGNLIFYTTQACEFLYDVATNQLGGATTLSNNGGPYSVQGFSNTGTNTWNYSSPEVVWNLKTVKSINSDTINDFIAFVGFNGTVIALNGINGSVIWSKTFGNSVNGTIKDFIDTTHSNNFRSLMFSGPRSINVIDAITGNTQVANSLDNSYVLGCAKVIYYHFWNPMIVATTLNNKVFVLTTRGTPSIVFQYSFGNGGPEFAVEKVSDLKSIDGSNNSDNADEFVASSRDGRIICFFGGWFLTPGVNKIENEIPSEYELKQNFPNPFNSETVISYSIPEECNVTLSIYDITGREISVLINEHMSAGNYGCRFNAGNLSGGMYFYKLSAGKFNDIKKMVFLK